jgi:predicted site-specific integrase-resolvase
MSSQDITHMGTSWEEVYYRPAEAAERLKVSPFTMQKWRTEGAKNGHTPPRFIKVGRKVLYPESELKAYQARRLMSHTADSEKP